MNTRISCSHTNAEKMVNVAERIEGTCSLSLEKALQDEFENENLELMDFDSQLLLELDNRVKLCEICGWWCPTDEINEDGVCSDCESDEDED